MERLKGSVKWFNAGKGYGFLIVDGSKQPDIFVHFSNIEMDGFKTLNEGQKVTFELGDGKGGSQAVRVQLVRDNESLGL